MYPERDTLAPDEVSPIASVMAGMPEVWLRLLEDHVPDGSGRCAACHNHGTAGVPWPCTLQVIAADARTLYRSTLGEPGLAN